MHIRLSKIFASVFFAVVVLTGLSATNVGALSTSSAQGVEISPTLVNLNAVRGGVYNIKIKLRNVTASDLSYSTSVNDFDAANETGSPHIVLENKLPATASVTNWVDSIPQFSLVSQASKTIEAKITIPSNAESGGHYGVLRFSGSSTSINSTGVGLTASAGVLLLIKVDGTITEKASLASFFSANGEKQSFLFENSPINFVTRVQNSGNIHLNPTGDITIQDMFGNVVSTLAVNEDESNILPNSIRKFTTQYNGSWMIGRYTANLALGYGTKGQALTNTISFWVIPYKVILIGLFVIVTLVFVFRSLIKVYNRRIIEKSRNETKNNKISKEKRKSKK